MIRIAFLVTKPMSIIMPISLKILSVCLKSHKENTAPAKAMGTHKRIINGSTKLSN